MKITPEMIRILAREALRLGAAEVAATCADALLVSSVDQVSEERYDACVPLEDRWRATWVRHLSLDQLRDLHRYAMRADDRHATKILSFAMRPDEMCRIASAGESLARDLALGAWNARAARLRAAGIAPWAVVTNP